MPGLSSVDFTVLAGDALNTQWFEAKVILNEPKKTDNFPRWGHTV
jgi:hypothetical protein